MFGGEFANVLMQQICNPFWKDVFKHYKKKYTKCLPESMHDFVSECIHYNIDITIKKRVVYIKDWFDAGTLYVNCLLDKNGSYLTFDRFEQLLPSVRSNILTYGGVISATRKCHVQTKGELIANYKAQERKMWLYIQKDNKCLKSLLVRSDALPVGV